MVGRSEGLLNLIVAALSEKCLAQKHKAIYLLKPMFIQCKEQGQRKHHNGQIWKILATPTPCNPLPQHTHTNLGTWEIQEERLPQAMLQVYT